MAISKKLKDGKLKFSMNSNYPNLKLACLKQNYQELKIDSALFIG